MLTSYPPLSQLTRRSKISRIGSIAIVIAPFLAGWLASSATAQSEQSVVTLPIYQGRTTDELFVFDLADGSSGRFDRLSSRAEVQVRPLEENLFEVIGRGAGQAARVGEMLVGPIRDSGGTTRSALVVESSAGYPLYFERLGRGGKIGEAITFLGRPFQDLSHPDGNFALLMRRDNSGRTVGAFLYHGTTGRAVHIDGVDELKIDPALTMTENLPITKGPISAVPVLVEERSVSYLVIDVDGNLSFLDTVGTRLQARDAGVSIAPSFTGETLQATQRRFTAVGLENSDVTTVAALVVDAATGGTGLILGGREDLRAGQLRIQMLPRNLYDAIPGGKVEAPRVFELTPHNTSSGTRGAWVIDSLTRVLLYIDRPDDPTAMQIVRPAIER